MSRSFLHFLVRYKYEVIFPIAVLEGPIITMVSGFLVSMGRLSLIPTLLVVFFGDMVSDSALYALGKYARKFLESIPFLKISEARLARLEAHYETHPKKTIAVSKASYGVGSLFIVAAGASKMGYAKFLEYVTPANAVKSSILLAIGYYFGRAYREFGTYLGYYGIAVIIILPIAYYLFSHGKKRAEASSPAEE